jgi:hypothetical protein
LHEVPGLGSIGNAKSRVPKYSAFFPVALVNETVRTFVRLLRTNNLTDRTLFLGERDFWNKISHKSKNAAKEISPLCGAIGVCDWRTLRCRPEEEKRLRNETEVFVVLQINTTHHDLRVQPKAVINATQRAGEKGWLKLRPENGQRMFVTD